MTMKLKTIFRLMVFGYLWFAIPNRALLAQTPPTFQSASFLGGAGDQEGRAIAISGSALYVSGIDSPPGSANGLLARYPIPPTAPTWSTTLGSITTFLGLA